MASLLLVDYPISWEGEQEVHEFYHPAQPHGVDVASHGNVNGLEEDCAVESKHVPAFSSASVLMEGP